YYQMCFSELKQAREKYIKNESIINDKLLLGNTIYLNAAMARLEIFEKNYMNALIYLDKCSRFIKKSFHETDERFVFSTGLYQYYIAFALKKYPFLYPVLILYPKGNKEEGLRLLNQGVYSQQMLVRTESRYFLMKIYLESESNIRQSKYWASKLISEFPENMLFNYYYFLILIEEDKIDEARNYLNKLEKKANNNQQLNKSQREHFIKIAREKIDSAS
ncbi:hypothetical protein ACFLSI_06320, partial [Bacteroidota bacterium]